MELGKYSFGIGDRFAHEGAAQLKALIEAEKKYGIDFVPVWNKSNREHQIVGTDPADTRIEADNAVRDLNYRKPYFVDADHININNVDKFIDASDFFTIDVADYIGKPAAKEDIDAFVTENTKYSGAFRIPGIAVPFNVTLDTLRNIAEKYVYAVKEAGRIYRHIVSKKGSGAFITEISMDEVDTPQTPLELFFILSALAGEHIDVQTIAPKFCGRFNKGVEYVGDIDCFASEFEQDLLALDYAVREFGFSGNLKLSIHSGSDKFAIYPIVGKLIRKYDKGIHIKTAGTTWLEEMIGLSMADNAALDLVKEISINALDRIDELCAPYRTVIDIRRSELPDSETIRSWSGKQYSSALRHDKSSQEYNPDFRQLIHVAYKLAAERRDVFFDALERNRTVVGEQVTGNLLDRHICKLFI